jgi:hypothetical protein
MPAFCGVYENSNYQQSIAYKKRFYKFLQKLALVEHSIFYFAANVAVAHNEL